MKINIPGKTFLVGEYSVLMGGSALGIATKPFFEIIYNSAISDRTIADPPLVFHPASAAGLYLKKYSKSIQPPFITIKDPYPLGGFGRSTAEYFAVAIPELLKKESTFYDIFAEYKSLHSGSGADLAFQYFGKICLADPSLQFYQTFNWHFENLDFFILSTGLKISTHEHLSEIKNNKKLDSLRDLPVLSNKITRVFSENREFEFLALMKEWCKLLNFHGLTHTHSLEMKAQLESFDSIKLAKPCGALGADVMIIFFAKTHQETVKNHLLQNKFHIQAHSSDLSAGVASQIQNQQQGLVDVV